MIPAIMVIIFVQHPFHTKIISEFMIFLLTAVLGVTNGITGSVPMIFAPAKVVEERRELAGKYKISLSKDYKGIICRTLFYMPNIS